MLIDLGMGLIIGTQVGSGIFSSPGVVVAEVGSAGASLTVWVVSALLAWTGARWVWEALSWFMTDMS